MNKSMKHENFNTGLSKQYLEYLGITNITEDGRVFKGEEELAASPEGNGYLMYKPYDKEGKQRNIKAHRAVYAWHHGYIPPKMQIDHLDGDRHNNNISNLRLATAKENQANRHHNGGSYEMRCSMKYPRSYYEDKLKEYETDEKSRSRSTKMSVLRAKLRYYDSHAEEHEAYLAKQSDKC